MRCEWPFGAMGDGPSQRASQFSPRVTASDVPALPLLHRHQQSHCAFSCERPMHQFGRADEASSSPSYCEPRSSSRFRPTSLTAIISS